MVAGTSGHVGQARKSVLVMLVLGFFIAAFGLSSNLALSAVMVFMFGASLMVVFALNSSLVQLYVTDQMRGRVMSVYNVAFRGGMPLGSLMSGLLIKQSSAPVIMAANGFLVVVMALGLLRDRKLIRL